MWGRTPPKAIVARISVSSSSSPRMASCRWRGVIRLTFRSLAAFYEDNSQLPSYMVACGTRNEAEFMQVYWQCDTGKTKRMTHACELKDFGSQIFENGCNIDGSLSTNAHLVLCVLLQETLNTATGELRRSVSKTRPKEQYIFIMIKKARLQM